MSDNRLKIISTIEDTNQFSNKKRPKEKLSERIDALKAKFERLWLIDKEKFNPLRNCLERERMSRTWSLLTKYASPTGLTAVDIGCASGVMSRRLRDAGSCVSAVDIAENALRQFKKEGADGISLFQEAMPSTKLGGSAFQLVICTELIAEIPQEDYRLFFAELARVIHPKGFLICSTTIDISSDGAIEKLTELCRAEFDIIEDYSSYHALYLRCRHFFESPSRYVKGWQEADFKRKELASLNQFGRIWFQLCTQPPLIWFWLICKPLLKPICNTLKNNRRLLLFLEKTCRFFYDQRGISHYIFIAKRRSIEPIKPSDIPIQKPKRQEIWE